MKNVIRKISALLLVLMLVMSFSVTLFADEAEQILDYSGLNRTPAGGYGAAVADGDNIAFSQNGTMTDVRFVGVVFDPSDRIPDQQKSEAMAEELYMNGINLVVMENVFEALSDDDKDLDETKTAAFDVLVHELYRKGIYVYLKMFTPASLGVGSMDMFFGNEIVNLTQRFMKKFLSHYNLNGATYAKDPTVVAIQYSSGASMIWANAGDTLPDAAALQTQFNLWLTSRYEESVDAMRKLWNRNVYIHEEAGEDEDFLQGTVKIGTVPQNGKEASIEWDALLSNGRQADYMQFLADTEATYFASFEKFMRQQGYDRLLLCSDTSNGPLSTKLAGLGDAAFKSLTYTDDMTLTDAFGTLASGVISGKPFFAAWDTSVRMASKAEAFLKLSMYASFQGWDSLILGRYSYDTVNGYNVKADTEIWSLCGLYANIFRSRYISEAKSTVDIVYSEADALCESGLYGKLNGDLVFFSKVGNTFLAKDEAYKGGATVAIASGNTASGAYDGATSFILHSVTAYTDQYMTKSDKNIWFDTEINKRTERGWKDYRINDILIHASEKAAVVVDHAVDDMALLSGIMCNLSAYDGKMLVGDIAYSDTDQLAYDLSDGTLTLTGRKVIIISDSLKEGVNVDAFRITTTSEKNNVVIYTPDNSYLSAGNQYIAYVGGIKAGESGTLVIDRANYDCIVYGINADGTRGKKLDAVSDIKTSLSTINLTGDYELYQITFEQRHIDDAYVNGGITAPEPEERPNLLLLITLPAAGFLAIAVVIVILNDRKRARIEEELRVSSLAAIKKKQAEHKRKLSRFDDEDQ